MPATPSLFADPPPVDTAVALAPPSDRPPVPLRRGHGRRLLPRDLPRRRVEYDRTDAERLCPCCQKLRARIGEEVSERRDYKPASLFVVEHVRAKYACRSCRAAVVAPPPLV